MALVCCGHCITASQTRLLRISISSVTSEVYLKADLAWRQTAIWSAEGSKNGPAQILGHFTQEFSLLTKICDQYTQLTTQMLTLGLGDGLTGKQTRLNKRSRCYTLHRHVLTYALQVFNLIWSQCFSHLYFNLLLRAVGVHNYITSVTSCHHKCITYGGSASHVYVSALYFHSTTENLVVYIWEQLSEALGDKSKLLYEVCVHETDNNTFIYRGE